MTLRMVVCKMLYDCQTVSSSMGWDQQLRTPALHADKQTNVGENSTLPRRGGGKNKDIPIHSMI